MDRTAPLPPPAPLPPDAATGGRTPVGRRRWYQVDGWPRWFRRCCLVVLLVGGLVAGVEAPGVILFGFVLLAPLERLFRRHEQPVRRRGLRADMFHAVLTPALVVLQIVPLILVAVVLSPLALSPLQGLVASQPHWLQVVEAIAVVDLAGYAVHRLAHEIPFLWRFHKVHHSSQALDWISAFRIHPFDGLFAASLAIIPGVLLGFDAVDLGIVGGFIELWGVTLHMNLRWRLRALDGLFATTEFHHWHHSLHAVNTNYAGVLPVWDVVFGTYHMPKDERPLLYGVDEYVPDTWTGHMLVPFRRSGAWEAF